MFKALLILSLTILSVSCQFQLRKSFSPSLLLKLQDQLKSANTDDIIQILDGFFLTVGVYNEIPAFAACKDFDFSAIKHALDVISDAMTGQYTKMMSDLVSIGKDAWNIYSSCDSKAFVAQAENGWKDVEANFKQADYFSKMTAQVEKNMFQLLAEAQGMYNAMMAKQFNDFGKKLGELVRIVLVVS